MNKEQQTILPLPLWALLLIVAFCWPSIVFASPRYSVEAQGAVITLTDDPCELDAVKNLPYKATWVEDGKTFQGCFAPRPEVQLVVAYFDDRTVALIPFQALKKLEGV
jgi:hypothetical protein